MATTVTVKRATESYWAGDTMVPAGALLPSDDTKVVAIYTEDVVIVTAC